eukprot:1327786-Heterocapsa_arctica.AAC.1
MASPPVLSGTPERKQKKQEEINSQKEQDKVKQMFDDIKGKGITMTIQELVETLGSSLSQGYPGMDGGQEASTESLATQVDCIASLLKAHTQ